MARLATWLRSRWTSVDNVLKATVLEEFPPIRNDGVWNDGIWCVHCRARRTVRRIEIATSRSSRRLYRRLVGRCTVCQGETSTFVPDED